jgi:hypothetical protein
VEKIAAAYGTTTDRVLGTGAHGGLDLQEQWLFYQRLLRMSLEQLAGFGFRSIYLAAGHYPLIHFVRPVAVAFTRATKMAGQIVTTSWGSEIDFVGYGGDHAGQWETSLMIAVEPTSVSLDELQRKPEYIGVGAGKNAVNSSVQQGEEWLQACAEVLAEEARSLVENYPHLPRHHNHRRGIGN